MMSKVTPESRRVFICGSALRGQPDHQNLQGAEFVTSAATQPRYRLHVAGEDWHPAIHEVESGGISIPGEVYEMTQSQFDYLASNEPPNMYPADVYLDNGDVVTAFLYPKALIDQDDLPDISKTYGSWAAYKARVAKV